MFRLVLILQSARFPNARDLAVRCEVSRRTIYRDLELLAAAGIPVRYRGDRQRYQLANGFFLPPTNLEENEALGLVILARLWKGSERLGPLRHAWDGALKIVLGLSTEARERVRMAAEPFHGRLVPGVIEAERQAIEETILSSLSLSRQVRLWYQDETSLEEECTKFGLYRVIRHGQIWYLVGRSSVHRRVKVIGLPWIHKAILTADAYGIPPRFNLDRVLGQAWGVRREGVRYRVWLRFSSRVAPELREVSWNRTARRELRADGRLDLHFTVDGLEEILRWVLGFGDQVDVLSPSALQARLFQTATAVARRHAPSPQEGNSGAVPPANHSIADALRKGRAEGG
ncbi:MAG: WYL domain-containing protein [Isosphaeraceae bacterium]